MPGVTIYHNPRCSKSRQTLQLLEDRGVTPTVVRYLDDTPTVEELRSVLKKLKLKPADVIRRKEAAFTELNLAEQLGNDDALIQAMADHPVLIERPIVVRGKHARLGRPPENVLDLL